MRKIIIFLCGSLLISLSIQPAIAGDDPDPTRYEDRIALSIINFGLCIKPFIQNGLYTISVEGGGIEQGEISSSDYAPPNVIVTKSILYLWNQCPLPLLGLETVCEEQFTREECSKKVALITNKTIKAQGK